MRTNRIIADRIRASKYRIYCKELAHLIGLEESIYLMYLIDQDCFINEQNVGNTFFKQQKFIYIETSIKMQKQQSINKKLKEMEILEIVKIGLPAKNNFKINYHNLEKLLDEAYENFNQIKDDKTSSSAIKFNELDQCNLLHINNKEINNKNYINLLHKSMENTPEEKKRKGLKPLIDYVNEIFSNEEDKDINELLVTYLKSHLGCRRLPDYEVWIEMISGLMSYSSISLPGTTGKKFLKNIAIEIINKAIQGKDGAPFTEFDDLYGYGNKNVMEPQINLNQDLKGY